MLETVFKGSIVVVFKEKFSLQTGFIAFGVIYVEN